MVAGNSHSQYNPNDVIHVEDEYMSDIMPRNINSQDPIIAKVSSGASVSSRSRAGRRQRDQQHKFGGVESPVPVPDEMEMFPEYREDTSSFDQRGYSGELQYSPIGRGGRGALIDEGDEQPYGVPLPKSSEYSMSRKSMSTSTDEYNHPPIVETVNEDSSVEGTEPMRKHYARKSSSSSNNIRKDMDNSSHDGKNNNRDGRKDPAAPLMSNNGEKIMTDQFQGKQTNEMSSENDTRDGFVAAHQGDGNGTSTIGNQAEKAQEDKNSSAWISNLMNTIFNPELCRDHSETGSTISQGAAGAENNNVDEDSDTLFLIPCGKLSLREKAASTINAGRCGGVQTPGGCTGSEQCNPVVDETVSVSHLMAGEFGDLQSLPSLEDSIINKAGGDEATALNTDMPTKEFNGSMLASKVDDLREKEGRLDIDQDPRLGVGNGSNGTSGKKTKNDDAAVADNELDEVALEERLVNLTRELSETQQMYGQYDLKCAPILASLADVYAKRKDFATALNLEEQSVSIYCTKLGDDNLQTQEAKLRCSKALENAGNYDGAISMYYNAMAMRKALNGDKDPNTADILLLIAHSLRLKGHYMQAIRELKRALKLYRDCLGDAHASVAATVDEIASLYVTLGDFEKSAAILEEVVKLKAATLGMSNHKVAQSLVDLATSYECSENFDLAIKALKKAYKIYTDLGGFSCDEATSTLQRIALIYQASGDMNKAGIAYLGVLRGKKHLLGDDHLDVAETYFRLGVCLRETDQLDKSLKCMKEALPILVGKGKDITDVEMIAEVMHEMALLYKSKGQLSEAARIFKQELTVRRKIGQPDYPCIANTLNHLGVAEYEMKMHRRALKHLLEVLTIFQERREQGIDFAEALFNIGLVFEALKNKERAYEAFLEAARVFKNNGYSKEHPHLVKAVNKVKRLAR